MNSEMVEYGVILTRPTTWYATRRRATATTEYSR